METETLRPDDISNEKLNIERRRWHKRRITIFIVVSLLNVALLAFLWFQLLTPAQNSDRGAGGSSPLIGHPAPNFTLAALSRVSGSKLQLASFKGKPVVLNF